LRGDNDLDLVEKSLEGDGESFRRLIERYSPIVHSVVLGILGNSDDVDDTVQEIFIKVYRGLHTFRGDSKLSTWIYRIARNESLNVVERSKYKLLPIEEADSIKSENENPAELYSRKNMSALLRRFISTLNEHYRVALELRYMGEKTYSEIAEIMEIPEGTVKTYIHRAKKTLKGMISVSYPEGEWKGQRAR
jgi:RNA polymerase sigma-70 factor (ECF subfamily)